MSVSGYSREVAIRLTLATAFLALAATGAAGIGAAGAQEADRFTMEKTADGYVRLNSQTGEMSICKETSGQLVCRLAADDRVSLEDEMDRMSERLDGLEKRLALIEDGAKSSFNLPTDQEIDKTVGVMQRFFRGFAGIVKELDSDLSKEPADGPIPDRT